MRNIWLLIKTNIKRNPMAIVLSVIFGFFLCLSLYLLGNYVGDVYLENIKIGLIDYDDSVLSRDFKLYLSQELDYDLIENHDYDYLSKMLIDKDISVIIEIPYGFYEGFVMEGFESIIITSTDDFENTAFIEAYMNSYLASISILSTSANMDKITFDDYLDQYNHNDITIERTAALDFDIKQFKERQGFINTVGFFLMLVFALSMILSFMIIEDRNSKIFNRITITPVKASQYIAGNGIFGFILLMIGVVIYCSYIALMNIDVGFSIYKLFILMMLLSLFVILFTIIISILFTSKSAIVSCVMGFSTLGAILGGAYFPIDMVSENLQNLARVLPQFWFMDGIRNLTENPMANITSNIIILILYILLSFLLGAVLFSQYYKEG